jgi:enoyl-CoA hydratase
MAEDKGLLMFSFKHLNIEIMGRVVVLRLGDGSKMNAMSVDGHAELPLFFREFQRVEEVSVAVVTGAVAPEKKPAFSVGGDLDLLRRMNTEADVRSRVFSDALELVRSLIDLDKPLVAAVNGPAMGAGAITALLSDFIYMERKAVLADGHIRAALAAGDGGTIAWPLAVGLVKAKQYLMTGDFIDAVEAERLGLVTAVVPDGEALERGVETAKRLADGPQPAIRATKRALHGHLRHAYTLGFEQALLAEEVNVSSSEASLAIERLASR